MRTLRRTRNARPYEVELNDCFPLPEDIPKNAALLGGTYGNHVFFTNLSPHFGHVICSFPFLRGTRRMFLQLGHLKNLWVLIFFVFTKNLEILVLIGHQILMNLSFSARLFGIFLESSRKRTKNMNTYETNSKKEKPKIPCAMEIIIEKIINAILSWSGPYLPIIKFLRKFLITHKPPISEMPESSL